MWSNPEEYNMAIQDLYFTKLAASLQAKNNKKYTQILTRLYGGKEEMYSKLKDTPQNLRGVFHGTNTDYADSITRTGLRPGNGAYGKGVYLGDYPKATRPEYFHGALFKMKGPNQATADKLDLPDPRIVFSDHPYHGVPKPSRIHVNLPNAVRGEMTEKSRGAITSALTVDRKNALINVAKEDPKAFLAMDSHNGRDAFNALKGKLPYLDNFDSHMSRYKAHVIAKDLDIFNKNDSFKAHASAILGRASSEAKDTVRNMKPREVRQEAERRGLQQFSVKKEDVIRRAYFGKPTADSSKFDYQAEPNEINIPGVLHPKLINRVV